jgi:hypothetical protein
LFTIFFFFVSFFRYFLLSFISSTHSLYVLRLTVPPDHTQRRVTLGRTPLDEWSALNIDFYLTTHNTQQTDIQPPPGEIRTQNPSSRTAADHAATGTGSPLCHTHIPAIHFDVFHSPYVFPVPPFTPSVRLPLSPSPSVHHPSLRHAKQYLEL